MTRSHIIVATAIDAQSTSRQGFPPVRIICQSQSDVEFASLAGSMTTQMTSQGFPCSSGDWSSELVNVESIYIVLDNAADPILASPTADNFTQIVSLITKAKSVLWISCQASGADVHNPAKGMVSGLARVVRRENAGMRFVTVDVQDELISGLETVVS